METRTVAGAISIILFAMPTTVGDIASALENWAPPASKFDYDNVGLQIGFPQRKPAKALVALDLTSDVIDEAVEIGAEMIITHHPLFFIPQKRLVGTDPIGELALRMAEGCIAYYAIHTNLDVAHGGVSFGLAAKIGLDNIQFLKPDTGSLVKLVVFVPESHAEAVRSALASAGAGRIGQYSDCSFETKGTGRFRPSESTNPHIGEAGGGIESVEEIRLEVEVERWNLSKTLRAVRDAHPYEEVAYDVFPMEKASTQIGSGAIGSLAQPVKLDEFLSHVASSLESDSIRFSGDPKKPIRRVAVCGGAGPSLIRTALQQGADAFITGDVTYHRFFEALNGDHQHQMAILDVGHYESEAHTEQLIVDYLNPRFEDVEFVRTRTRTSPMQTFVRR